MDKTLSQLQSEITQLEKKYSGISKQIYRFKLQR